MFTNASVILPAAVASAFSSNSVRSSKNDSTSAAYLVPAPRSIRVAPREKKPFGIPIRPDATPDNTDSIVPTLLFLLLESGFKSDGSAIYTPIL